MYVITISMDPEIVDLWGQFTIDWHGIMVVLALVCGVALTLYLAKKEGMQLDQLFAPLIAAVIGGILISRFTHVVDQWEFYYERPREILNIWAGSSIIGAVIGGAIGAAVYAKIAGWSWTRLGKLADIAAPGSILGMAIGRLGCTINGDAWGTPTGLPWGITYTHPNHSGSTFRAPYVGHPTPVYEIIWDMLVFTFLMVFRKRLKPASVTYWMYLSLYSLGRFLITFVRVNDPYLWGLKQAQVITLFIMVICVPLLIYLIRNRGRYKDYT
ncbi:prolipoprotein diacylglyceryl transferase [Chloroflexota bacterium]